MHRGWTSRGYIPHCDGGGIVQHIVFSTVGSGEGIAAHFGAHFLASDAAAACVQDSLLHFDAQRYRLLAWCVMPNHAHVVAEQIEGWPLSGIVHSWKSFTGNQINRILGRDGPIWMREYFDRFMRDDDHLAKTMAYVERNPVARGYVEQPEHWRWSSAAWRSPHAEASLRGSG
jgi:REP element-mobilizing transposase RayT